MTNDDDDDDDDGVENKSRKGGSVYGGRRMAEGTRLGDRE